MLIALMLLGGAVSGSAPAFTLDSFRWQAAATMQAVVTATNDWGDIRVRTAQRGGVAVSVMIQRIGTPAEELAVRVDEGEDAVTVAVVPLVAAPRGRVDLTSMVPAGMRLEVATRDGVAEVKHKGDVVVRTVGGAVTLLTPGHARVETSSGDVEAKLTAAAWERPVTIASDSGDVTLWLPTDAAATLEAEAGGGAEVTRPAGGARAAGARREPHRRRARAGVRGVPAGNGAWQSSAGRRAAFAGVARRGGTSIPLPKRRRALAPCTRLVRRSGPQRSLRPSSSRANPSTSTGCSAWSPVIGRKARTRPSGATP